MTSHEPRALLRRRPASRSSTFGNGPPPPRSPRRAIRARKIRPGYDEGPLIRVAAARHQAEAEMIQGLLLEEGIPSLVRRSGGLDVPDFLAAGPRGLVVAASGEEAAREILGDRREEQRVAAPRSRRGCARSP